MFLKNEEGKSIYMSSYDEELGTYFLKVKCKFKLLSIPLFDYWKRVDKAYLQEDLSDVLLETDIYVNSDDRFFKDFLNEYPNIEKYYLDYDEAMKMFEIEKCRKQEKRRNIYKKNTLL